MHHGYLVKNTNSYYPIPDIWIKISRTGIRDYAVSMWFQLIQWLTKIWDLWGLGPWWRVSLNHTCHWIPDYWGGHCDSCPGSGGGPWFFLGQVWEKSSDQDFFAVVVSVEGDHFVGIVSAENHHLVEVVSVEVQYLVEVVAAEVDIVVGGFLLRITIRMGSRW